MPYTSPGPKTVWQGNRGSVSTAHVAKRIVINHNIIKQDFERKLNEEKNADFQGHKIEHTNLSTSKIEKIHL